MSPKTERKKHLHSVIIEILKYKMCVCLCVCVYLLCGHEEGLDDAVHETGVPQVDQTCLACLGLPSLPQ